MLVTEARIIPVVATSVIPPTEAKVVDMYWFG
jgi:hypothetical protein